MEKRIERVRRGSTVKFRPLINGKKCGKTLYARLYDAKAYLRALEAHYGDERLATMFAA
jgi:hypothetical protein